MANRILDYSKWTYSLPQNPTEKDYAQLASKLKTYVDSPKFLRQGSTVDEYDPQTGKRVKRPITNVIYRQTPGGPQGLSSQELRKKIQQALLTKDKQELEQASKYHYFTANKFQTLKQRRKQQDKDKRKRILLEVLAFGTPAALAGASVPFITAARFGDPINAGTVIEAAKLGGVGFGAGALGTGLLESLRSEEA